MAIQFEMRPSVSPQARVAGPLANKTVRRILDLAPFHPEMLRLFWVADRAAFVVIPPRGTVSRPVRFPTFDAELITGPHVTKSDRAVLYFHGGAFVACGLNTHRRLVARISAGSGTPVLNVAYRQLPRARLHETIDDCVEAYRWLLEKYAPEKIVVAGDSAGGYLSLATVLRARDEGLPLPAGIAGLSPWLDLMCLHSSAHPNATIDPYMPWRKLSKFASLLPVTGHPIKQLINENLSGLPPVFMQVGSTELLRCDAEMMADALDRAGVPVRLQVWEDQVHVFQAFADLLPEGHAAIRELGTFIRARTLTSEEAVA